MGIKAETADCNLANVQAMSSSVKEFPLYIFSYWKNSSCSAAAPCVLKRTVIWNSFVRTIGRVVGSPQPVARPGWQDGDCGQAHGDKTNIQTDMTLRKYRNARTSLSQAALPQRVLQPAVRPPARAGQPHPPRTPRPHHEQGCDRSLDRLLFLGMLKGPFSVGVHSCRDGQDGVPAQALPLRQPHRGAPHPPRKSGGNVILTS